MNQINNSRRYLMKKKKTYKRQVPYCKCEYEFTDNYM